MKLVYLHCHQEYDKALNSVFLCFVQEIHAVIATNNDKHYLCEI